MNPYAAETQVSVEKSRAEIENLLIRCGERSMNCPTCKTEITDENRTHIGGRDWCSQKCWRTMMDAAGEAGNPGSQPGTVRESSPPNIGASPAPLPVKDALASVLDFFKRTVDAAVKLEREACIQICHDIVRNNPEGDWGGETARAVATGIARLIADRSAK